MSEPRKQAMRSGRGVTAVFLCVAFLFLAATTATAGKKKNEVRDVEVFFSTLTLEAVPDYPAVQEGGGIRIELVPVPPEPRLMKMVSIKERTNWGMVIVGLGEGSSVWVTEQPFYTLHPSNLQFKLRITNHLGKLLRFDGVAIQFLKDGEQLPTDYTENTLNKAMILPEKSWEGVIHGPKVATFEGGGVLMVGLYDVVTELDAASNPTKRTNFEWIFSYERREETRTAQWKRYKANVTPEQAAMMIGEHPAVEEP